MLGVQLHLSVAQNMLPEVLPHGKNVIWSKPQDALWTSTYDAENQSSGWVDWCIAEQYGNPYDKCWFLLTPDPTAKIYTIDTWKDARTLLKDYRRTFTGSLASLNTIGHPYPDYERLSQDYDAIHMTEDGQEALRWEISAMGLYGYDCESTAWFRWKFTTVEKITPPNHSELNVP